MMMLGTPPLVYGFDRPHRPGTVCWKACEQCGLDRVMFMTGIGPDAEHIEIQPLRIVREASRDEYVASCVANGGGEHLSTVGRHYYVVETD